MPKFNLDFSKIPVDKVEDGEYDATLDSVELRQAQNSEFPYLNWAFVLSEGEASGRKVFMTTSLGPKSLWNARDQFQALGFDPSTAVELEVDDDSNMVVDPPLSSIPVRIAVYNETYNGRQQPKVSGIVKSYAQLEASADDDAGEPEAEEAPKSPKKPKLL